MLNKFKAKAQKKGTTFSDTAGAPETIILMWGLGRRQAPPPFYSLWPAGLKGHGGSTSTYAGPESIKSPLAANHWSEWGDGDSPKDSTCGADTPGLDEMDGGEGRHSGLSKHRTGGCDPVCGPREGLGRHIWELRAEETDQVGGRGREEGRPRDPSGEA